MEDKKEIHLDTPVDPRGIQVDFLDFEMRRAGKIHYLKAGSIRIPVAFLPVCLFVFEEKKRRAVTELKINGFPPIRLTYDDLYDEKLHIDTSMEGIYLTEQGLKKLINYTKRYLTED